MPLEGLCFFLTIWAVSWAQRFVVSQPSSAEGTEGSSVTLRCSYSSAAKPSIGSYQWVKDPGLGVRNTTREVTGRVIQTSEEGFLAERRADIEILELRHYDSGVYQCVVNIPGLGEITGNGTELRVVKPPRPRPAAAPKGDGNKRRPDSVLLGIGLGSALVTSVAAVLLFLYCRNLPPQNNCI